MAINGQEIRDIIDFQFHCADEYLEVLLELRNGENQLFQIEKDFDEELGISFKSITNDGIRQCHNRCLFCFVDQMPPSLRPSLYVKDDDYRYSFLQGTFVTLTNITEHDLKRIASLKLSPLYVSVHTTNPELRVHLLRNKNARRIMHQLEYLAQHGIEIHAQIVLCEGINDGKELERTIEDLKKLWPAVQSLAVVPVGLTQFRNGLVSIKSISPENARNTIEQITMYQQLCLEQFGTRFVYLADEFYLLTKQDIPAAANYEGFPQLENGVGIVRLFLDDFANSMTKMKKSIPCKERCLLITGVAAAPVMDKIVGELNLRIEGIPLETLAVKNNFLGNTVTVAGLLSGSDIISQVKDLINEHRYTIVILPDILLNEDRMTIDNYTEEQLQDSLGVKTVFLPSCGASLVDFFSEK